MLSASEIVREAKRNQGMSFVKLLYQVNFNSSKNALFLLRWAQFFYFKNYKIIAILVKRRLERRYGFYVSLNTEIEEGLKLPHVTSIVIGDGVKIGKNVTIYQQVTLGGKKIGDSNLGNYPKIGNDVIIYAGAKILGGVIIGDGATIGANSVVIKDVEPYSVYAGIPAKRIR